MKEQGERYDSALEQAIAWAKANKPNASPQHQAAFANSVAYLVSGFSGGFGGPSCREHLVSWSLAGACGHNEFGQTSLGSMTIQYPDGTLPLAGEWDFDKANEFAAALCFGEVAAYRNLLLQILEREHCFDDDPADLEALRRKSV